MQTEGAGHDARPETDVVVHLEFKEMSKDVSVDKIKGIYADGDDNHQLVGLIIGVVKALDTVVGVGGVGWKVSGAGVVDTEEIFIFEHLHALVVVVYEITHAGEGAIDDGNLPCLMVVHLACPWQYR